MGAYKQFNSQDIIISPLEVNKSFTFRGNELTGSDVGIDRYLGENGDYLQNQTLTGQIPGRELPTVLVYDSVKQLYYSNYISGSGGEISNANTSSINLDGTISPPESASQTYQTSYYNYEETTLNPQKTFNTSSIGLVSVPSKLCGNNIKPGSVKIESPVSGTLYDDGEGRLYITRDYATQYVGNVIYEHGIIVISNPPTLPTFLEVLGSRSLILENEESTNSILSGFSSCSL